MKNTEAISKTKEELIAEIDTLRRNGASDSVSQKDCFRFKKREEDSQTREQCSDEPFR